MKGLKLMYHHKTKPYAIACALLGLCGALLERVRPLILYPKWDAQQHYAAALWVALVGLYTLAYCKEKFDDERTQQIRLKSLQIAFLIMGAVLLSMGFINSTVGAHDPKFALDGFALYAFAFIGITMYLLNFYTGLYYDVYWDYADKDRSLWQNIKEMPKNAGGVILYLLTGLVTVVLMMLLFS